MTAHGVTGVAGIMGGAEFAGHENGGPKTEQRLENAGTGK